MKISTSLSHQIIILPGLSDRVEQITKATNFWRKRGLEPHVVRMGWRDVEQKSIEMKLDEIIALAERLSNSGRVSILGISAGGSAALNAFISRPDLFFKATNVCGRLRAGNHHFRSFEKMSKTSKMFRESILKFEKSETEIPHEFRERILTVSALFGDELVPADTSGLEGAKNIRIPTVEHGLSIGLALTVFSGAIFSFVKS